MKTITKLLAAGLFLSGLSSSSSSLCRPVTGDDSIVRPSVENQLTAGLVAKAPHGFRAMVSGNGIAVAVDNHGQLLTSSDGRSWARRDSGVVFSIYAIAFGNGVFVAAGNEGAILTSSNGIRWILQSSATDDRLRGVAWGNGRFVAVGHGGTVVTSEDSVQWTKRESRTDERLQNVAFSNGKFVVTGLDGKILTSNMGIFWAQRKPDPSNPLPGTTAESRRLLAKDAGSRQMALSAHR